MAQTLFLQKFLSVEKTLKIHQLKGMYERKIMTDELWEILLKILSGKKCAIAPPKIKQGRLAYQKGSVHYYPTTVVKAQLKCE